MTRIRDEVSSRPKDVQRRARWQSTGVMTATLGGALGSLTTMMGFAGELWWPLELACHFRVQYLVALLAIAMVLTILGRRGRAIVVAGFAAANLAVIAPLYVTVETTVSAAAVSGAATPLRVVLVNVHSQNREFSVVIDFLREQDPDVIVLEEITPGWRDALTCLDGAYPYSIIEARVDNFGIALFSKRPLQRAKILRVGRAGLPSVLAELDVGSTSLTILGTHPGPPVGAAGMERRDDQLGGIARLLAPLETPVLLIGDLNATPWSPAFQDLLATAGLKDSTRGFGFQPTWPTWCPPTAIPIDHCLHSDEIHIHGRSTGPHIHSDHLPLIVDLSIEG